MWMRLKIGNEEGADEKDFDGEIVQEHDRGCWESRRKGARSSQSRQSFSRKRNSRNDIPLFVSR